MEINMKDYNLEYFKSKDLYTWDEIIAIMEDMEADIHSLREEKEDLENDIRDNYKPISKAEQYGYSERDFI